MPDCITIHHATVVRFFKHLFLQAGIIHDHHVRSKWSNFVLHMMMHMMPQEACKCGTVSTWLARPLLRWLHSLCHHSLAKNARLVGKFTPCLSGVVWHCTNMHKREDWTSQQGTALRCVCMEQNLSLHGLSSCTYHIPGGSFELLRIFACSQEPRIQLSASASSLRCNSPLFFLVGFIKRPKPKEPNAVKSCKCVSEPQQQPTAPLAVHIVLAGDDLEKSKFLFFCKTSVADRGKLCLGQGCSTSSGSFGPDILLVLRD